MHGTFSSCEYLINLFYNPSDITCIESGKYLKSLKPFI